MSSMNAVRRCPRCSALRPATELLCQGAFEGNRCNWDLTDQDILDAANAHTEVAVAASRPPAELLRCPAGHVVAFGDLLCPTCGRELGAEDPSSSTSSAAGTPVTLSCIGQWTVMQRLTESSANQKFRVQRESDGRIGILTLHCSGIELDDHVYQLLQHRIDRDYIAEVLDFGRWEGRAFEVNEEITGGSLQDLVISSADIERLKSVVREISSALTAFAELGLRHRAIRPEAVCIRAIEPLDLVITDFGAARLSDLDLDLEAVPAVNVYTAPEAVMGGVAAASDWWGLGMILLHIITAGKCLQDVNQQLFLIHVLSNGAPIPDGLDPQIDCLLRGLLFFDRSQRWQGAEVRAWLDGKTPSVSPRSAVQRDAESGPAITLARTTHFNFRSFTLAAPNHWNEAVDLLERGAIASWADERGLDRKSLAALRLVAQSVSVPRDFRLGLALRLLNPSLPFLNRQEIIEPQWLIKHHAEGFELISGPTMDLIRRINLDSDVWLRRLAARANDVRQRARELQIELDETDFRIYALSSSRQTLMQRWALRRAMFPDTEHSGLAGLLERKQLSDEDLHILLSAAPGQFRPLNEIVEEVRVAAAEFGLDSPSEEQLERWLGLSRRDIFSQLDERIQGFARCGHQHLDVVADRLRLERRIPIAEAMLLLAVPTQHWQPPPNQEYLSSLLGFFEKRVVNAVLRGPLVRMKIGKWTPRVDLMELGVDRSEASALLERLLQRTDQAIRVNPSVFDDDTTTESRMYRLVNQSHMHRRDTGVNGLYLAFPFLLRQDSDRSVRPHLAPILLWPLRIDSETGHRGSFSLAFESDREVLLNPAFEGLLGAEVASNWKQAADELLGRSKLTVADVMDSFGTLVDASQRQLRGLPDLTAEVNADQTICSATLFHVTFVGQAIAQDLRVLHSTPPDGSALATLFRLSPSACDTTRQLEPTSERYLLTASDPSQEQAVAFARQPPGLLIQGPPGTGKSQTIVNLVADTIGQGKSALIICQKLQALNVVKKRLVAEGLADRIVMVTDVHKERRVILEDIRAQLAQLHAGGNSVAAVQRRKRDDLVAQIRLIEEEIDRRHDCLRRHDELSGLTYRQIIGELVAIEDSHATKPLPDVVRLRRLLRDRPASEVHDVAQTCLSLGDLWLMANYEGSPLAATKPIHFDPASVADLQNDFGHFVGCESVRIETAMHATGGIELDQPVGAEDWLQKHGAVIESASAELCNALRQHYSLFAKFRLGGEYLELLEEMIAIEEGWASPCMLVPELERYLSTLSKSSIQLIADECRDVASTWLASNYEGSPLHALQTFSGPDSIAAFHQVWNDYYQAEATRVACLADVSPFWELTDPASAEEWLEAHEQLFVTATDVDYKGLALFLPLFEGGDGKHLISVLSRIQQCHAELVSDAQIPALVGHLAEYDEPAVQTIISRCQALFESWIRSDFEDNALRDLAEFQPTRPNEILLVTSLNAFCAAEAARLKSLDLPLRVSPGADLMALQEWLAQHEGTLNGADAGTAAEVLRWQKLFFDTDRSQLSALQASLRSMIERLAELDRISAKCELRTAFASLPLSAVQESLAEARVLSRQASWWSYFRLRQMVAHRRIRALWQAHGVAYEPGSSVGLDQALSAEIGFRQICSESKEFIEWLGADPKAVSADHLVNQLRPLDESITRVGWLIALLLGCPVKLDIQALCQSAQNDVFRSVNVALRNEVSRQTCSRHSLRALDGLRQWFKSPWIDACRANILADQTNMDRIGRLKSEWPKRAQFLGFRAGADECLRGIFATMVDRRATWRTLPTHERQHSLERTLFGHWLLAQKQHLETRYPVLARLRIDALEELTRVNRLLQRVKPLAAAIQSCPEPTLADNLSSANSMTVGRQWLAHLRSNLDFVAATQETRRHLQRLQEWFHTDWIQQREQEILKRQSNVNETCAVTSALPTLAAFQEFRAAAQGMQTPTRKVLELLSGERTHFRSMSRSVIDSALHRIVLYHGVLGPKRRIEMAVASLSDEPPFTREQCQVRYSVLSGVATLVAAFETCPFADARKAALAAANPTAFQHLVNSARGAVERAKCRQASLAALNEICDRMQPEWQQQQESIIRTSHSVEHLAALQKLHAALPQLGDYQAFRLRASKLSTLAWGVFAALALQRKWLLSVAGSRGQILNDIVRREALLAWAASLEHKYPALLTGTREAATQVAELSRLDAELKQANRNLIMMSPKNEGIGAASQWEDITRYHGARALRLREFFKRGISLGLKQLRPVWLMIPEVASQLLPLEPGVFDLVIYDEASQMPVEYAVPSLYRSQQVVISGDEKQMPPSSAFKARIDSDEEDYVEDDLPDEDASSEERQAFEETWNRREIKDCPDLLHLGQAVLPKSTLQIHYRSECRELIAFSNAAFYNNELSVPNRHVQADQKRGRPIEFFDVGGVYENQTNEIEADKVIELLAKIWRVGATKVPSVGIVTFNMKQADLIDSKLELKAEEDERFSRCLDRERNRQDDGEDMALFVKNVENVQGDERDVIIFSTTFGKSPAGVFRRNFGALGQKGGERRLNVAVTRARKSIKIVSSMPIGDISDLLATRRRAQSPRDFLQAYLEYARLISGGQYDDAQAILTRLAPATATNERRTQVRDGVLDSVQRFIASFGFSFVPTAVDPILSVNCSVLDPTSGRPGLAIDCDPPQHPLLNRARARDIWRREALQRYCALHVVSPRAWYLDRKAEEQRLLEQLEILREGMS